MSLSGGGSGSEICEKVGKTDQDETGPTYSRKNKALGLLCTKFISHYSSLRMEGPISLDDAASLLGVERRRIYDIVNILESLSIVSRAGKNTYSWHGVQWLPVTLSTLRARLKPTNSDLQPTSGKENSAAEDTRVKRREKSLAMLAQAFLLLFLQGGTSVVTLDEVTTWCSVLIMIMICF
jgi:transcription factor E2F7/8